MKNHIYPLYKYKKYQLLSSVLNEVKISNWIFLSIIGMDNIEKFCQYVDNIFNMLTKFY